MANAKSRHPNSARAVTRTARGALLGTYAVSKAGLGSLVKTWAGETSKTNMRVNIIDPGSTRTGMRAKAFPGEDPMSPKTPEDITQVFVDLASPDCARYGEVVKAY